MLAAPLPQIIASMPTEVHRRSMDRLEALQFYKCSSKKKFIFDSFFMGRGWAGLKNEVLRISSEVKVPLTLNRPLPRIVFCLVSYHTTPGLRDSGSVYHHCRLSGCILLFNLRSHYEKPCLRSQWKPIFRICYEMKF
jgi:hypothetical protein